jgi:hypothetical protein
MYSLLRGLLRAQDVSSNPPCHAQQERPPSNTASPRLRLVARDEDRTVPGTTMGAGRVGRMAKRWRPRR